MQGFKILTALCALVSLAAAKDGKLTNKNICFNIEDGTLFPVARSCSKFIVCVNKAAVELDCGGKYQFNVKTLSCDLPERVGCEEISITSAPPKLSSVSEEKEVVVPKPTLPTCFAVANGISLPVPGNQRQYYFCMNNKAFLKDCGNMYFVAKYSACAVKPDISDSAIVVTPPKTQSSNQHDNKSSVCSGKPNGLSLPVAGNSHQYNYCMNNKAYLKDCGSKMIFVAKYSACTVTSAIESEESVESFVEVEQTKTYKEVARKLCSNQLFGTRLNFPGHCSLYVICTFNFGFVKSCGWREFNSKTASCDLPQNVRCQSHNNQQEITPNLPSVVVPQATPRPSTNTLPDRICLNKKDGIFIAAPGICSEFFFCLKNKGYRKSCGENRHFNPKSMICEDVKYSKCIDIFSMKKSVRAVIPRDESSCVNKENGTLLNSSTSCGKFYICDNGATTEMDCPSGLYFNSEKNVCDWPTNVECKI